MDSVSLNETKSTKEYFVTSNPDVVWDRGPTRSLWSEKHDAINLSEFFLQQPGKVQE